MWNSKVRAFIETLRLVSSPGPSVCASGGLLLLDSRQGQIGLVNPGAAPGQVMADPPGFRPTRRSVTESVLFVDSREEPFLEEEEQEELLRSGLSLPLASEVRETC